MAGLSTTSQRLVTETKTRVSAAQRQALMVRYALMTYIGLGFALSALLIYNDFFSGASATPHLSVYSEARNVQTGQEIPCTFELLLPKGLGNRDVTIGQEWPEGIAFVGGSLEVNQGHLRGADIPPYGGSNRLQISGIDPEQRKIRFQVNVRVNEPACKGGVIAPTTTLYIDSKPVRFGIESTVALEVPGYRVSQRVLSTSGNQVRYQVVVSNPPSGKLYGVEDALHLMSELFGADVSIEEESVEIASLRPVGNMTVSGQKLEVKGLTLGPGEIATLTFAARLESPAASGQQLTSKASVFVPHSFTHQSTETQVRF